MPNIREKIDLTAAFSQKELINELFRQNLTLQAHIQALHATLTIVIAEVYHKTDGEAANLILDQINKCGKNISENNEFLVAARKASKKS